ncbi:MAG: aminotransferase class V-fold PLP-dependent enzyme [Planctomycetota bacterium]
MKKAVYFDNAATSWPKPDCVYEAMNYFMKEVGANPGRSGHSKSIEAARTVHNTRETIARLFNVKDSSQVIFTLNATHALNLVFKGILHTGDHVLTTSMEHNSVMRPLRYLEKTIGIEITTLQCLPDGHLPLESLEKNIKGNTKLIAVTHASNVTGTLMPIREIGEISRRYGALFLVDAAQTAGVIPLDMVEQNIDLLIFTGHKSLMGPTGTGGVCMGKPVEMAPLIHGGTGSNSEFDIQPEWLPDKFESGTLNTVGIAGLGAGIKFIQETGINKIREREKALTKRLLEGLSIIKGIKLYGPSDAKKQIAVVSFNIETSSLSDVGYVLDREYGIMARIGLQCAPIAHKTIGTFPKGTIRFSLNYFNSFDEVDYAIDVIRKIIA